VTRVLEEERACVEGALPVTGEEDSPWGYHQHLVSRDREIPDPSETVTHLEEWKQSNESLRCFILVPRLLKLFKPRPRGKAFYFS